jgi:hypothetical protein
MRGFVMELNRKHVQPRFSLLIIGLAFILTACGGGGGGSTNPVTASQGVFVDSVIEGLRFETSTQSGLTDLNGIFNYIPGETVKFYVGDILIGSAAGAERLTPIDLVPGAVDETNSQVTNIARFLQTLDSDSDPSNGIKIGDSIRSALTGQTLDFSLSEATFETAFDSLNTAVLGGLTIVTAADAQAHLRTTLDAIAGGSTGNNSLGSLSITGTAADTAVIGSSFTPATVISNSVWLESSTGNGVQFSISGYNEIVGAVSFSYFGSSFYKYDLSCGSVVAGDRCSNVTIDLGARSATFNNLILDVGPSSYGGFTNMATDSIVLNGTLYW